MVRERFWPLIQLHSSQCGMESPPPRRSVDTLHVLALRTLVSNFSDNPRSVGYRKEIERLPVGIRLDVLCDMCDHPSLADALLQILSNPSSLSALLQYVPLRASKLVSCLQWLESVKRSLPELVEEKYRQLVGTNSSDKWADDYRCGLRIGTFLAHAGWYVPAVAILKLNLQQTRPRSDEELIVLTQLLQTLSRCGKLTDARLVYHRVYARIVTTVRPKIPDLMVCVYHTFSLYHYERHEVALSYFYGVQSLELLNCASSTQLVWDVFRQLARACLAQRCFRKGKLLLDQALARAGHEYGLTSAPYAETLEDYAVYLLAQDDAAASEDVFSRAQHIYLKLFGSRNLLLATAQGSLTFGLCRQAFAMRRREEYPMVYVHERLRAFRAMMGPDHRFVVQLDRLLITLKVILFDEDRPRQCNKPTVADTTKLRNTLDQPLAVDDVRRAFHRCQEQIN